jgi:hypothetical protein
VIDFMAACPVTFLLKIPLNCTDFASPRRERVEIK